MQRKAYDRGTWQSPTACRCILDRVRCMLLRKFCSRLGFSVRREFVSRLQLCMIGRLCELLPLSSLLLVGPGAGAQGSPDSVCRKCHEQDYDRYERTPMARASGDATEGFLPGEFLHQESGIEYRLSLRDKEVWLFYDRPQGKAAMNLAGEQRLVYYIGSGHRGRTYLFERNGFWFESPVNWYSKGQLWDMNPKSLDKKEMPFTLQVDSTCLHCHTSGAAMSLPGSRNHFADAPFAEGGITCESCHGDASAHLAQSGRGPVLNPADLTGSRRDSICLQCHLEAEVAVNQPGRSLNSYRPGDDLSEDVRFFVYQGEIGSGGRATSQWEALLQSACYRKSAGRMTCTTCHDPHSDPPPTERVQYFRSKCLTCHGNPAFVTQHHPQQPDCTPCHMAWEKTENVANEQVTDHFIVKRPWAWLATESSHEEELVAVGGAEASDRDLGLDTHNPRLKVMFLLQFAAGNGWKKPRSRNTRNLQYRKIDLRRTPICTPSWVTWSWSLETFRRPHGNMRPRWPWIHPIALRRPISL